MPLLSNLYGRALRRDLGKADDVAEVHSDRLEVLGRHLSFALELLRDRLGQHLVQQAVGLVALLRDLPRLGHYHFCEVLSTGMTAQ